MPGPEEIPGDARLACAACAGAPCDGTGTVPVTRHAGVADYFWKVTGEQLLAPRVMREPYTWLALPSARLSNAPL